MDTTPPPGPRPLDGVVVIACEQAVAAPFATRQLADLGADVVKVERPDGGDFARGYDHAVRGLSSHFVWLNRSKRSVVLDLKEPDDADTLRGLVAGADVFVANLAPGALARLGLDPADLRATNPRLVTCSISGYGTGGPAEHAKAYDALIQAESGLVSVTGTPQAPAKAGIPVADIAAGMYAYSGILAALLARERTGEGAHLEVAMLDALVEWMGFPLYYTSYGGQAPPRSGTSHAAIAPYGAFHAADGTAFMISIQNEREWAAFCEHVLGDAALAARWPSVAARVADRAVVDGLVSSVLGSLGPQDVARRLDTARTAWARLRDVAELPEHPQLVARGRWTTVDSPVGPIAALLPPVTSSRWTARMDPIPALGADQALVARPAAPGMRDDGEKGRLGRDR